MPQAWPLRPVASPNMVADESPSITRIGVVTKQTPWECDLSALCADDGCVTFPGAN